MKQKIRNAYEQDANSKFGTYIEVNPTLATPLHNEIETGRYSNPIVAREYRVCVCGDSVHTLKHVFLECPLIQAIEDIRFHNSFTSVSEFFDWPIIHDYLIAISKTLKIEL